MASVTLLDLTEEISSPSQGCGILDILIEKFEKRILDQYNEGRIVGSDFATVYIQGYTEILKASIGFLLEKDKAATEAMIGQATVVKQWGFAVTTDSEGDLVMGADSGQGLIDQQVLDATNKVDLTIGQIAKIYADVALVGQQQTTEIAQTTDPSGGLLGDKASLIQAQTLGFASDTKQKILKQMMDGYAVTLSISGGATPPDAVDEPAIDALVHEILTDVGSTAIDNTAPTPGIG